MIEFRKDQFGIMEEEVRKDIADLSDKDLQKLLRKENPELLVMLPDLHDSKLILTKFYQLPTPSATWLSQGMNCGCEAIGRFGTKGTWRASKWSSDL